MTARRNRLFVIDGPAVAYQAFHAISGLSAADGSPTGAVFGFLGMLRKMHRQERPDLLVVAWDHHGPTFRDDLVEDYKGTRAPMPEDLVVQIGPLKETIAAYRIPLLEVPGFEADDIMATLAQQGVDAGLDVVLVSRDKDCKQLLGPHVSMFDAKSGAYFDEEKLFETSGLKPSQWIDYQSLVGDSSDNIKGVKGIGPRTATSLLEEFGSVENAYANLEAVENARTRRLLEEGRESVALARELVTLRNDVPLERDVASLACVEPDRQALIPLFRALGFRSLLEETVAALPRSGRGEPGDYTLVTEIQELRALTAELLGAERIAIFCAGDESATAPPAGLAFAATPGRASYVPLRSPDLALDPEAVRLELLPVLRSAGIAKVCHGSKRLLEALSAHFAQEDPPLAGALDDTMLQAYLIASTARGYDLSSLAAELLEVRTIPREQVLGRGKSVRSFHEASLARVCEYACEAADVTLRLHERLSEQLVAADLAGVYHDVELPLVPVLARMERAGMQLDIQVLQAMSGELGAEIESVVARAHSEAGQEFNLGSLKEVQRILFDVRGLEPVRKGKTGPSTDAASLEQIHADTGDPLCGLILRWRELTKLVSTYVDALPRLVDPETGRLHTTLHQAVAATGRLSSSDPNLQNIPVRTELGRRIRSAFAASDGCRLISGDYSQIELRVLAHYSEDAALVAAFEAGEDIHASVAARLEGVAVTEVTSEQRRRAKVVNFGIIYGQTAFGLARELGISRGDASRFIDAYFQRFPGVRAWIESVHEHAREQSEVRTMAGRRRPIPDMRSRNPARRGLAERTAVNTVIQGTAADILKLAMIALDGRIRREERPERILLQIHDELILEAPTASAEQSAETLADELSGIVSLRVPLVVNTAIAANWGGLDK